MAQKVPSIFSKAADTAWGRTAVILVILFLALVLRILGLGTESAWIDEAYSINLARHAIPQIIQGTAADQHPPLYYLLLHFWFLVGSGVVYARLLSVIIGVIQIYQTLALARMMSMEKLGWVTGLLLAVSPMHVWYSQEIRMYILLASLTTASTAALWASLHGKPRWWLYAFFSAAALYTHYFAAFIMFAQAILVIAWAYHHRLPRPVFQWSAACLFVGLSFAPWVPVAINQTRYHTMTWIHAPRLIDIVNTTLRLLLGEAIFALPDLIHWGLGGAVLLIMAIALVLALRRSSEFRLAAAWAAVLALLPFGAISFISAFYPIFQFKQFIIVLAPLLLLAVVVTTLLPKRIGVVLFVGLLLSNGASLTYQQLTLSKDDWRGAAAYIQSGYQDGDLVYGNPAAAELALSLYWNKNLPFDGYPPQYDIVTGGWDQPSLTPIQADRILRSDTSGKKRLWLIEFSPEFRDPSRTLEAWLSHHSHKVDDRNFGQIRIRLYQLQP